jgi:uncharacterized protein YdeI (YjbR/CyaY-like superfamily)
MEAGGSLETETENEIPTFYASSLEEWRFWLAKNGGVEKAVRLILYHKSSKTPCVRYKEAIEHALCFGWVDSRADKRDGESSFLTFTPRNPKSTWSLVNKERAEKLIKSGLMAPSGQALVDYAKSIGTWNAMADAQKGKIPADLQKLFNQNEAAYQNFLAFTPSTKRNLLEWILKAKKPETRQKRLEQTVEVAANRGKVNS